MYEISAQVKEIVHVYLEGVGDGQSHDAWAEALSGNDSKQSSKWHNAVSHKLQANRQPPAETQIQESRLLYNKRS